MRFFPLLLASLLALSPSALAWNKKGHATIAAIAEASLTPAAKAKVQALLRDDLGAFNQLSGRTSLADIASWPDEIRKVDMERKYAGWHTRSNPVCQNKLGVCWFGRCVDRNLQRYAAALKDERAPHRERNEALKWIVHLVGDLHTPLHSGSNYDGTGKIPATMAGGQKSRDASLHALWDHELLTTAMKEHPISAKLTTTEKLAPDAITQWMLETRDISRKHVYEPLPGFVCGTPFPGPVVLDLAYQRQAFPVIRLQIERAGLRLAQLLNELLD